MRRLRNLSADVRGNSAVELGLVAPMLAAFVVGMVDVSHAVAERLRIEQAAQRAIERVMQEQETSSTFTNLAADAAAGAGVPVANVTVTPWLECDGASVASGAAYYTTSCTAGQVRTGYVKVVIAKTITPFFGTRFFPGANTNGTITMTGTAGMRIL